MKYILFCLFVFINCSGRQIYLDGRWTIDLSKSTYMVWQKTDQLLGQKNQDLVQSTTIQSKEGTYTISVTDAQNRSKIMFLSSEFFMENALLSTHYFPMKNGKRATIIMGLLDQSLYCRWEWIDQKNLIMIELELSPVEGKGLPYLKQKAEELHKNINARLIHISS
jgi:hypothetical protein